MIPVFPFIVPPNWRKFLTLDAADTLEDWVAFKFWLNFKAFAHVVSEKGKSPYAQAVFLQRSDDSVAIINCKFYYKENEQWLEETFTKRVPENELPTWAKTKLDSGEEVDITDELERESEQ